MLEKIACGNNGLDEIIMQQEKIFKNKLSLITFIFCILFNSFLLISSFYFSGLPKPACVQSVFLKLRRPIGDEAWFP